MSLQCHLEGANCTVSSARKCAGSWFHAFGPATSNAREPKCMAEELTTRSPRVADRSLCLLPTDVTGRQRSAIYGSARPWYGSTFLREMTSWMCVLKVPSLSDQILLCVWLNGHPVCKRFGLSDSAKLWKNWRFEKSENSSSSDGFNVGWW